MILNVSYGTAQAQIIDFTVSGNDPMQQVTIPGVFLSGDTVDGIMLYPTSTLAGLQNGCVYYAWKNPVMDANKVGTKWYFGAGTEYRWDESPVGVQNPVVYNPTDHTLFIRVEGTTGYGLYPGNYRVVVW